MKKNKPHLPIDLMIVNTLDHNIAQKTLAYCAKFFEFNNIIMISDTKVNYENYISIKIDRFKNLHEYSDFCLRLIDYVKSDHLLLVQDDGHIVNPNLWEENFLNFDYIGAPWPASGRWLERFKKYDDNVHEIIKKNIKKNRVGNGGFSLRSSKFLEYSTTYDSCNGIAEDIFLSLLNYEKATNYGIKFPDFATALKFSTESGLKGFKQRKEKKRYIIDPSKHFGWHGKRCNNAETLMNLKFQ
jgi:hypothetical protein